MSLGVASNRWPQVTVVRACHEATSCSICLFQLSIKKTFSVLTNLVSRAASSSSFAFKQQLLLFLFFSAGDDNSSNEPSSDGRWCHSSKKSLVCHRSKKTLSRKFLFELVRFRFQLFFSASKTWMKMDSCYFFRHFCFAWLGLRCINETWLKDEEKEKQRLSFFPSCASFSTELKQQGNNNNPPVQSKAKMMLGGGSAQRECAHVCLYVWVCECVWVGVSVYVCECVCVCVRV